MDIESIISKMTLKDKIAFCTGADMWHTKTMEQYGIPSVMMTDGPHGLRVQRNQGDNLGLNDSEKATCFPTAVTSANSWNPKLLKKVATAIAEECKEFGVSVVLGPGANIKRNPLGGRNFEYFSEDPYLAGKMAAAFIQGVEQEGIGTSLKHFACNNQEYKRQNGNSIVDERALHEIYLKPFEIAVREGHPSTVMCSYNQINGVYSSDNKKLLTDILRNEWGFDGMVVTDWGAMANRIKGFQAGCDLNMPGGATFMEKKTTEAVKNGTLSEEDINTSVRRILKIVERGLKVVPQKFDRNEHHALAEEMAKEGAVLLKNDGILPLKKESVGFIGHMAEDLRYQGSGSSHINPTELKQVKDLWPSAPYASGVDKQGNLVDLEGALNVAKSVKTVVVFAGLPEAYESEAFDRESMDLPEGHNRLIKEIVKVNPNVVVVLYGGSAMTLPWANEVRAILYMGLPGQGGAKSTLDLLEGKANPSGKLSESWPVSYDDVVSKETFGVRNPEYRESIYVGYRYYDKANVAVRYPFGYGLSYTTFAYSNMEVSKDQVSVSVTNTGSVAGKETVQLYVSAKENLFRPVKELKAFEKIELEAGETKKVTFAIRPDFFEVYDNGFRSVKGSYVIAVGPSSNNLPLQAEIPAEGEAVNFENYKGSWYEALKGLPTKKDFEALLGRTIPNIPEAKRGSYTMDNSSAEMRKDSLVMKIQYAVTKSIISKPYSKEERTLKNPAYKMMLTCSTDCPMRAAVISSNGAMNDNLAEGLVDLANGHYLSGLKKMMKKQ